MREYNNKISDADVSICDYCTLILGVVKYLSGSPRSYGIESMFQANWLAGNMTARFLFCAPLSKIEAKMPNNFESSRFGDLRLPPCTPPGAESGSMEGLSRVKYFVLA